MYTTNVYCEKYWMYTEYICIIYTMKTIAQMLKITIEKY